MPRMAERGRARGHIYHKECDIHRVYGKTRKPEPKEPLHSSAAHSTCPPPFPRFLAPATRPSPVVPPLSLKKNRVRLAVAPLLSPLGGAMAMVNVNVRESPRGSIKSKKQPCTCYIDIVPASSILYCSFGLWAARSTALRTSTRRAISRRAGRSRRKPPPPPPAPRGPGPAPLPAAGARRAPPLAPWRAGGPVKGLAFVAAHHHASTQAPGWCRCCAHRSGHGAASACRSCSSAGLESRQLSPPSLAATVEIEKARFAPGSFAPLSGPRGHARRRGRGHITHRRLRLLLR